MNRKSSGFLRLAKLQSILALKAERQAAVLREERERIERSRSAIELFRTSPRLMASLAPFDSSLVSKGNRVASACESTTEAARLALAKRDKWQAAAADAQRREDRQAQDRELEEALERIIQRAKFSHKEGST